MKYPLVFPGLLLGLMVASPLVIAQAADDPSAACTREAEDAGVLNEADKADYIQQCLNRYQGSEGGASEGDSSQESAPPVEAPEPAE